MKEYYVIRSMEFGNYWNNTRKEFVDYNRCTEFTHFSIAVTTIEDTGEECEIVKAYRP